MIDVPPIMIIPFIGSVYIIDTGHRHSDLLLFTVVILFQPGRLLPQVT